MFWVRFQEIFTNREIAYMFWLVIIIIGLTFTKGGRKFYRDTLKIIFCKKFIVFYCIFIGILICIIRFLKYLEFWDISLLKDTIVWVIFAEVPVFIQAIENAKDSYFFRNLIKDAIQVTVIVAFIINFWSLPLIIEIIIVPITAFLAMVYFLSKRDREYIKVKKLIDIINVVAGIYLFYFAIKNLFVNTQEIFNLQTIKILILPINLLILNIPVIYGLALYSQYEQVSIRLKGTKKEEFKMKLRIVVFGRLSLYRLSMLKDYGMSAIGKSFTEKELRKNLNDFKRYLDSRIGDNYMRRARFYFISSILFMLVALLLLVYCNSEVSIKDIITFNFILDINKIKEIINQISIVTLVGGVFMFIFAIGFKKQKYEDLSMVKKIALSKFLPIIYKQGQVINEGYINEEDSNYIFNNIIVYSYKLLKECDVVKSSYDNLLSRWELESINQMYNSTINLLNTISYNHSEFEYMTEKEFTDLFEEKIQRSSQNDKINVFIYDFKKAREKYISSINVCLSNFDKLF